ncbi:MAG: transglycosylase domain-containing protein [Sulfurimonas sp.]|uniref:transglycosylase domain-containing protein n=1 Tax=Sulfurimonas sp. TaxID=2022749 RepID=UPI0025ED7EC3|nr:transglycosylase domain-containing protein [Sulfurimonas sp.]MCK9490774.1 transglycosylase domain-containing protein [Sulfurimonas sp.]
MRLTIVFIVFVAILALSIKTYNSLGVLPTSLQRVVESQESHYFYDKRGKRLNTTYLNQFNTIDLLELHEVDPFFIEALLASEDKNFMSHSGVDWGARSVALFENIKAFKTVRGASTLSEQVVRILIPRPRTLLSRWVEGFDATRLESYASKSEILHFYINQVPFAAKRKGFKQAASYYFDRDFDTLSQKEILALIVIIRSPRWYDPSKYEKRLQSAIMNLATRLYKDEKIDANTLASIEKEPLQNKTKELDINAQHFLSYVKKDLQDKSESQIHTTLDGDYQSKIQKILDTKLNSLKKKNVQNGAVLVIDHHTNEVVAWVVGFAGKRSAFTSYDPITIPRQPGSALKPFVYAAAIEKGWQATTIIEDAPLYEGVGTGTHGYKNYSNIHYGLVSLREALGNSLNIPAVKAVGFVGVEAFMSFLNRFGVESLQEHPDYYGDGIALGNAEISLLELTRAYATLARMGSYKEISIFANKAQNKERKRVLQEDIASLVGNILSDPSSRTKEFGYNSILNFPHQTAIKTGTSSDYRDAWSVAYDDRYCIGAWFGNLDFSKMDKVTGASGPSDVVRMSFSLLNENRALESLYLSPNLIKKRQNIENEKSVKTVDEYMIARENVIAPSEKKSSFIVRQPSKNLLLAKDPRIPDKYEYYTFEIEEKGDIKRIEWYLNDKLIATTKGSSYAWRVERGKHKLVVKLHTKEQTLTSEGILFEVL